MQKFVIGNFVANTAAPTEINTISFVELMKQAGADGLMPMETQYGTKIFLTKGGERVQVGGKPFSAIRIGNKANTEGDLLGDEPTSALKHLVNNNEVYWGIAEHEDNGVKRSQYWLCFSRKGTLVPGKVVSLADILAATGMSAADLKKTV